MNFNRHSNLVGTHAILSPSEYHWLNYDDDKLDRVFFTRMQTLRGVRIHEFAQMAINLGQKLPDTDATLNQYVNDAIGFGMTTEQPLVYSVNCYGHADAISFRADMLRIHDLKTGLNEAKFEQLLIYEALFCLEYSVNPFKINCELRIYQNNEVRSITPDPDDIFRIMKKIEYFSRRIDELKAEAQLERVN